jgi:hypothetical protein
MTNDKGASKPTLAQDDETRSVLCLCIVELSSWMRDHGQDLRSQDAVKRARALLVASPAATAHCHAARNGDDAAQARPTSYDGLTEELVDEVARLCIDAPGSRNAVYAALKHCNAKIVPVAPASSAQDREVES